MAKSFSDNERNLIKDSLIRNGRKLFAKYGLKKTGVGELTKAAGISQGAFYIFFDSKEELYFEILEMEEKKLSHDLQNMFNSEKLTKESFKKFIREYFRLVHSNPIIENLIKNKEYEQVVRKLPEEKFEKHLFNESYFCRNITSPLQDAGLLKNVKPEVLTGLFHALFLMNLHKQDIGEDIFPQIMELIIDLLSEGLLIKQSEGSLSHG